MDPLTQIRLTRELIDIDSTTGREQEAGEFIAAMLEARNLDVRRQPVGDGRFNIFALAKRSSADAAPRVVFSTHFDCVPPFFASREDGGRLYGRGSADAKGTLIAEVAALEQLREVGIASVGLLFVVGEERGSDGARAANAIAPGSAFLVNGEPTDNRLAAATRGVYRVKLTARGRAAHSSRPELGESAIDKLVDALVALRGITWPVDPLLGTTFYTTGLIAGGVAPNVISPQAEAELMFRTVGDHAALRELITGAAGSLVSIEDVLVVPPVRLTTAAGFDTAVFSFTTDIPFLDAWGAPLLIGPGSVTLAHTADEHVEIEELLRATANYTKLAKTLLQPGFVV